MFFQTNCMQAAKIDLDLQARPSEGPNKPSVWIYRKSVQQFPRYLLKTHFLSVVTLIFNADLQTRPSEGPNMSSLWICRKSVQQFQRYLPKTQFFVCGDLDLWPWHSNSSKQGTKHVFPVNLAQIRSAVPEIFHTQTKKSQTAPRTEPYTVHCVR